MPKRARKRHSGGSRTSEGGEESGGSGWLRFAATAGAAAAALAALVALAPLVLQRLGSGGARGGAADTADTADTAELQLEGGADALVPWLLESSEGAVGRDGRAVLNVAIGSFAEGRGLAAARAVRRGELLTWIPADAALSRSTSTMPAAGKELLQQACEEDKAMCVELPALLLFEKARGESSPHYPYIRSLPEEPPRNLPTWTREQFRLLTAFLGKEHRSVAIYQGSACAINLPKLLPLLVPILEDSGLIPGATTDRGLGMSLLDRWAHGHATADVVRACAIALSRDHRGSLFPLFDMANHDPHGRFGKDTMRFSFSPDCMDRMME